MIAAHQIKELRLQHNYTQNHLATKLRISQKTYSNLETGKSRITLRHLLKLSDVYKMDITELIHLVNKTDTETINTIKKENLVISNSAFLDEKDLPIELIRQFKGRIDDLKLLLESKDHKIQRLKAKIETLKKKSS